jgi:dTDP-4-amino-4,6-dideoxygalactose transaminase
MGDAGACLGKHKDMDVVRMYRDHGRIARYDIVEVGYNARIDNMQSNIVLSKLPKLAEWIKRKQKICEYYNSRLVSAIKTPVTLEGNTHSWYVYVLQTTQRADLQQFLKDRGVSTNIHYATPTHTQPAYQQWYSSCPVTEKACEEIVSIPCWYSMTDTQVDYVADLILEWTRK